MAAGGLEIDDGLLAILREVPDYGIFAGTGRFVVDRNIVDVDLGEYTAYALYCVNFVPLAIDNRLIGDATPISGCTTGNNYIDID